MKPHFYSYLFLLGMSLIGFQAQAQSLQLTGRVQDPSGPLPIATIILKQASDSSMVKTGITDNDGQFKLPSLSAGKYRLFVSFMGMAPYVSDIINLKESMALPPIVLSEASSELGEVTVEATRAIIEVQPDKTVFNVEGTLSATGSDGFQLLRKAPGVMIDNNDNIIVEGKSGVQIYINGKPSPLSGEDLTNFLKSLQASDIDALEIITQPSSKYDAAGNAGIINIRLKKDKGLGTNGTLGLGYAYGKNSRYNTSISFNSRAKHTNVFGSYSMNTGKSWSFFDMNRTQSGGVLDSKARNIRDNTGQNFRLGSDFFLNDRHTVGVLLSGNVYDTELTGGTRTNIFPSSSSESAQTLSADNVETNTSTNLLGNINYRYADTLGYELGFDVDYGTYSRDRNTYQPNAYTDYTTGTLIYENNYRMITPSDISIFSAKADYSQKGLGGQISVGIKYSDVSTDNTFNFYDVVSTEEQYNTDKSNTFTYTEKVQAAYVNYNRSLSKQWKLQTGLRAERTLSEGNLISTQVTGNENVKRDYTNLFPSGGLTFVPNPSHSWALTYSKRIQRPNYQSLNPFTFQLDELSFRRGNPFLQPQYTDNLKVSHTFKYRVTTSVSYSFVSDFFAQITQTEGAKGSFIQEQNIADQKTWNFGISAPVDLSKWWSFYGSLNFSNSAYEGQDERFVSISQSTLNFYGQNTFSLPHGIKLELSGWYNSPSVWGGTFVTKSLGSIDLAIQKKFMEDKLSVRVSMSDILYTSNWKADMQYGDLVMFGGGGWESRQVRINLSYNFGNSQVKRSQRRQTATEGDEGNRLGGE